MQLPVAPVLEPCHAASITAQDEQHTYTNGYGAVELHAAHDTARTVTHPSSAAGAGSSKPGSAGCAQASGSHVVQCSFMIPGFCLHGQPEL